MAKISWAGHSCFQVSVSVSKDNEASIVIDPFDEKTGLKVPNFSADILLITHNHYDHNNADAIRGNPFLVDGPGEYEIKGVFIQGISSFHDESEGKERGMNTIYVFEAEGLRLCHLGDFGQKQLTDEQLEKIGEIDVLLIPVGGAYTIDATGAQRVVNQIEPKIVIPMHYELPKLKIKLDGIDKFLKIMGKNSIEPQDKLTIKTSALPKEGEMEIVILKA